MLSWLRRRIPLLRWLPHYSMTRDLPADVIAGLSTPLR
jgi:MFS superfamily sulfate permease-like transporter